MNSRSRVVRLSRPAIGKKKRAVKCAIPDENGIEKIRAVKVNW